jgi:hypothetical protein
MNVNRQQEETMKHPSTVLASNYAYADHAGAPPENGGRWRFFRSVDPATPSTAGPSVTLDEHEFDAIGRPSTITVTVSATPHAARVP